MHVLFLIATEAVELWPIGKKEVNGITLEIDE